METVLDDDDKIDLVTQVGALLFARASQKGALSFACSKRDHFLPFVPREHFDNCMPNGKHPYIIVSKHILCLTQHILTNIKNDSCIVREVADGVDRLFFNLTHKLLLELHTSR